MSSIHRLGLAIASVVTVAAVAGTFVVQGYVTAEQAAAQAATQAAMQSTSALAPQIIYVSAAVPASPAAAVQQPQIIHVVVPGGGGDDGGSNG